MSYFIHETPGRIRIRTPVLKDNLAKAMAAADLVCGLGGIKRVLTNTKTGSLTVIYHTERLCAARIINTLARHRFLEGIAALPRPLDRPWPKAMGASLPPLSPQTKAMLKLAAKLLVPIVLERALGRHGKILSSIL